MGSDCHVMVTGGPPHLLEDSLARIEDLEQKWSRFRSTSEVSTLNNRAGTPVIISPETEELLQRALDARALTGGLFEPTILGDLIRAGYDRPFEQIEDETESGVSNMIQGSINLIGRTALIAPGVGFDPGGIGKGLAADIVGREAMAAGAGGVCVNIGGDVRVSGQPGFGGNWPISIDHPEMEQPLAVVEISDGAVATSTSLIRRWDVDGQTRHHLIDPSTGRPAVTDLELVAIIAGSAWLAEAWTKAAFLTPGTRWLDLMAEVGLEGIGVTTRGTIVATPGLSHFRAEPTPETGDESLRVGA